VGRAEPSTREDCRELDEIRSAGGCRQVAARWSCAHRRAFRGLPGRAWSWSVRGGASV